MEQEVSKHCSFIAPSGYQYVIREQNGADDDVLSNVGDANNLMNISKFIAGIVTETNATSHGTLTPLEAHRLPVLDRYCILLNSRIFSMGNILEFQYDWGNAGGKVDYEQDLEEFLYDYSKLPTEQELISKPDAIPFYPHPGELKDITFELSSGKLMKFDIMTGESEVNLMNSFLLKRTKNQELMARNLCRKINDQWETVKEFSNYSVRDMQEIRKTIASYDPAWVGTTEVTNPVTGEKANVSIMSMNSFFYPGEI